MSQGLFLARCGGKQIAGHSRGAGVPPSRATNASARRKAGRTRRGPASWQDLYRIRHTQSQLPTLVRSAFKPNAEASDKRPKKPIMGNWLPVLGSAVGVASATVSGAGATFTKTMTGTSAGGGGGGG